MLVQIHSPEAFKPGLKSRWCEEFVSYWSAKRVAAFAATVRGASSLLGQTLASDGSRVGAAKSSSGGFRVNREAVKSRKKEILGDPETNNDTMGWESGKEDMFDVIKNTLWSAQTEASNWLNWNINIMAAEIDPHLSQHAPQFPKNSPKKQLPRSLLYLLYVFLIPISFHFLPAGWRDTNMREWRWVGGGEQGWGEHEEPRSRRRDCQAIAREANINKRRQQQQQQHSLITSTTAALQSPHHI